jgi:hypothetical protein
MNQVKDTARATVRLGYDGRVHKTFRGPLAEDRFANEVRVLQYLEQRGCPFVPRLLEHHPATLVMVTTNCGGRVERMDEGRMAELFAELETYGVRHDDPYLRNVTYSRQLGRFCLIDFEFATILEEGAPPPPPPPPPPEVVASVPPGEAFPDARPESPAMPSPAPSGNPITDHR